MPTMTMTQKAYRELEQAAQMSGATKNVVLEKALSRYLAELRKNAKDARLAERLDKTIQSRIKKHMSEIATLDDTRSRGKALTSNLAGLWRYRMGDYRCFGYMTINWLSPSSNSLSNLSMKLHPSKS